MPTQCVGTVKGSSHTPRSPRLVQTRAGRRPFSSEQPPDDVSCYQNRIPQDLASGEKRRVVERAGGRLGAGGDGGRRLGGRRGDLLEVFHPLPRGGDIRLLGGPDR